MRLRIPRFRWTLLTLYTLLLAGFFSAALIVTDEDFRYWTLGLIAFTLATQALFIFGAGTQNLCRPIRRRRLWLPVLVASVMLAVLACSFLAAMVELFYLDEKISHLERLFWALVGLNWIGWFLFLFIHVKTRKRYPALQRMTKVVLAGSLAELLAAIPSHIIVSRRPGCMVGLLTMTAITGGVAVMLWSFGPGIALLFLRGAHERESQDPETPPARRKPQFSLAGLVFFVIFAGACMAMLLVPPEFPGGQLFRPELWVAFGSGAALLWRLGRRLRRWETGQRRENGAAKPELREDR